MGCPSTTRGSPIPIMHQNSAQATTAAVKTAAAAVSPLQTQLPCTAHCKASQEKVSGIPAAVEAYRARTPAQHKILCASPCKTLSLSSMTALCGAAHCQKVSMNRQERLQITDLCTSGSKVPEHCYMQMFCGPTAGLSTLQAQSGVQPYTCWRVSPAS
jgi:ribulose 1,5-bisphosphate carboxylase large subunit-like protein